MGWHWPVRERPVAGVRAQTRAEASPRQTADGQAGAQPPERAGEAAPQPARPGSRAVTRHLAIAVCYLAAGIAVTWPRATYLVDGKLPATRDAGVYVWDFWWLARQVEHLGNPWFTRSIAAPVGGQLGYHALMPLAGLVMMPVTVTFGPSASYNVLSLAMPGLLCYAMYRAARLWLPSQIGAIAAGGFFGLSSELAWHAWYQLNLAVGVLFLPLTLEAAVRLRRRPGWPQAVWLGAVAGASFLVDQESAVLVVILALAALLPWLALPRLRQVGNGMTGTARAPAWRSKLAASGIAAAAAAVVASPQLLAMAAQARSGGAAMPLQSLARNYVTSGSYLPGLFGVSPRAVRLGLTALKPVSYRGHVGDGVLTFGLVLTVLAVAGLAVSWRRRTAWLLALGWLGSAALALGSMLRAGGQTYVPAAEIWHGTRLSAAMPYTWFVQIPGLAGFREAGRLMMLGLVPAALLAGAAIDWLRYHAPVLIVPALVLGALEAGWAGNPSVGTMRTALPGLDRPIAADHSASLVVDVPFGVRGGIPLPGEGAAFNPECQVLATADGHPRAIGYFSRLPPGTLAAIRRNAFYAGLQAAQGGSRSVAESLTGQRSYRALLAAARRQAGRMDVGWAIVWHRTRAITRYLTSTGFRFAYQANGVPVYRRWR